MRAARISSVCGGLLSLWILLIGLADAQICSSSDDIPCEDGECIARASWCNGKKDCTDGSDEAYCKRKSRWNPFDGDPNYCIEKKTLFICENGPCIPVVARCDGPQDCKDGSDEEHCDENTKAVDEDDDYEVEDIEDILKEYVDSTRSTTQMRSTPDYSSNEFDASKSSENEYPKEASTTIQEIGEIPTTRPITSTPILLTSPRTESYENGGTYTKAITDTSKHHLKDPNPKIHATSIPPAEGTSSVKSDVTTIRSTFILQGENINLTRRPYTNTFQPPYTHPSSSRSTDPHSQRRTHPPQQKHTSFPPKGYYTQSTAQRYTEPYPLQRYTNLPQQRHKYPPQQRYTNPPQQRHTYPTQQIHTYPPQQRHTYPSRQRHTYPPQQRHTYPPQQRQTYPPQQIHPYPPQQRQVYPPQQIHTYPPQQRHTYPPQQIHTYPSQQIHANPPQQNHICPPQQSHTYPPQQRHTYPPQQRHTYPPQQRCPYAPEYKDQRTEHVPESDVSVLTSKPYTGHFKAPSKFYFKKNYTNNYSYIRHVREGYDWLLGLRENNAGWGRDTPRALIALSLVNNSFTAETNEIDSMKKYFQVYLGVKLLNPANISMTRLASFVNALIATCQNPRDFFGVDLAETLRSGNQHMRATFINPFIYLSLCLADANFSVDEMHALHRLLNNHLPSDEQRKDMLSLSIMAYACNLQRLASSSTDTSYLGHVEELLGEATSRLLNFMHDDGSFGSVYSTALAAQALISVNDSKGWNADATFNFLKENQKSDGSFGDLLATYYILPVLSGRSLLHLRNTHCNPPISDRDLTPIEMLEHGGPKHYIRYSLHFGQPLRNSHSVEVYVPRGINFFDVMRVAEHQNKYFKFLYDKQEEKIDIYSISGVPNDAVLGLAWHLYIKKNVDVYTNNLNPQELYTGDVKKLIPTDEDHLIFWYHPIGYRTY